MIFSTISPFILWIRHSWILFIENYGIMYSYIYFHKRPIGAKRDFAAHNELDHREGLLIVCTMAKSLETDTELDYIRNSFI